MNTAHPPDRKHAPNRSSFKSTAMPLLALTIITFLAFANVLPNNLVLDDNAFVGPHRPHVLDSALYVFTHDAWSAMGIDSGLYRPLLLLSLSLEARAFGDWLPGYHLMNIFLHLLATILAYGFFRQLLRMGDSRSNSSDLCALLAAMVFAVHPAHTEAVDSIFNRSEILVAVFGLAGLWWLLHYLKTSPFRAWTGLAITYFLAMLSKENAVVIPGLAVVLVLLFTEGGLKARIGKCLPVFWLLVPLALYVTMRAHALAHPGLEIPDAGRVTKETVFLLDTFRLPDSHTFLSVAGVLGRSIKVLVWPYPLQLFYEGLSTSESAYFLALNLLLILAAAVLAVRRNWGLAGGLAFFYIALLPASRIFNLEGGGPHLAERYLYFPSIGLAVVLAFALRALVQRFGIRVVVNISLVVVLVLTIMTLDRNRDWANDVSLYETEYQRGYGGSNILRLLTSAQIRAKNFARVVKICDENKQKQKWFFESSFVYYCAVAYEKQKRFDEAERAYLLQIEHPPFRIEASLALAHFYIRQNRLHDAEKRFLAAVDWSEDPAEKAMYMGEMILSLNPANRDQAIIARDFIRQALEHRPGWPQAETMLERLDNALNSSPAGSAAEEAEKTE